jgi:hypothetical protein
MTRLLRRRRRSRAAAGPDASPGAHPTGHLPFTPRAKKEPPALRPRGPAARPVLHRRRAPHARPPRHGPGGRSAYLVGARRLTGNPAGRHSRPLPAGQLTLPRSHPDPAGEALAGKLP